MKKEKRKGNYYKLTQEDFIELAKQKQIVPIDFSNFVYHTQHDSYQLYCTKHNVEYTQRGQSILLGSIGCPYCLREYKSKNASSNLEQFVSKFNTKFPDVRYDFSKSTYIKASIHIDVTCDKGHTFKAKPNNLMSGHKCPECFELSRGHLLARGRDSYIRKFIEVHGEGRYDYSTVEEFKNCKQKVKVLCYEHGEFLITPDNHVQGKGCPLCGKSGYQPQKAGTFYILKLDDNIIKFGITNNLQRRLKELRSKSSYEINILHEFVFEDGYIAQAIESDVYRDKSIIRNVVSKLEMQSGYVETTYTSNLTKILEIVQKHMPA